MSDFVIKPTDVFEIIRRQRWTMLIVFLVTFGTVTGLTFVLPKTYLAESTFHFGVGYFQNPLITGLVSQTHDPGEIRSERDKVISASLDAAFAEKMAIKYPSMFRTKPGETGHDLEVEYFIKSFDLVAISATQYTIKVKSRDAQKAADLIHEAINSIREYMYKSRVDQLEQLLTVIDSESVKTMAEADSKSGGSFRISGESASAQIAELTRRLNDLRRTFSEEHPSIRAIKDQLEEIKRTGKPAASIDNPAKKGFLVSKEEKKGEDMGVMSIKDELMRQKNQLNIALEIEKKDPTMSNYLSVIKEVQVPTSPQFPKLRLFLLFGLVAGVMISTIVATISEFTQRVEMNPEQVAAKLGIPVLGTVVVLQRQG